MKCEYCGGDDSALWAYGVYGTGYFAITGGLVHAATKAEAIERVRMIHGMNGDIAKLRREDSPGKCSLTADDDEL